jgi:hypothetical protein
VASPREASAPDDRLAKRAPRMIASDKIPADEELVTPEAGIVTSVNAEALARASVGAGRMLARVQHRQRSATIKELARASAAWGTDGGKLGMLDKYIDLNAFEALLPDLVDDSRLSVDQRRSRFGKALGLDPIDLAQVLASSPLVSQMLPESVTHAPDMLTHQLEGGDLTGGLLDLLLHGRAVKNPANSLPPGLQLSAPWALARANPTVDKISGVDGWLNVTAVTGKGEVAQSAALCGVVLRIPPRTSYVRASATPHYSWGVTAGAIAGYTRGDIHLGIGIWEGGHQLGFSEVALASAYAPALWLAAVEGQGDMSLSVDYARSPSIADQDLTVAVIARASVGGGGAVRSGHASLSAAVPRIGVQLGY